MPGVLSSIFDAGEGGTSQDSTETAVTGGGDLAVDLDVGVDAVVTWQDADGGTHSWQTENDVGLNADVGATVGAVLMTDDSEADY